MRQDGIRQGLPPRKKKVADADGTGWCDWRGPERAAISPFVPSKLPAKPDFLWRAKLSSQSLGGVAANDAVVIVSDKDLDGERDVWRCFDAATGKQCWEFAYASPTKMDYTSAPRATPVIHGDDVYLLGAFGQLSCVALRDGAVRWQRDLHIEFNAEMPKWGYCATPLLVDDLVIVNGAAATAFLAAFSQRDGELRWQTPGAKPGFGNFICATFGGRRQIIGSDADGIGGWDPKTGKQLWALPSEYPAEFKVPTPLKLGERLLLAAEQSGTRLHAFDAKGVINPKPVVQNLDMNPDVTSPVGIDGVIWLTTNNGLYCLDERKSLETVWKIEGEPFSDAAQLVAGNGRVLVLVKNGALALLAARPAADAKPQVLRLFPDNPNVEVWSQPALVRGRLFVRTEGELVCLPLPE